ncbi:MAG TPA: serine hydrolase domain-containing protein [Sphingomicrobium sp.]|nr:serine hydrolase domain-containing protein [Sphingomicrobium sp.]
MKSRILFGLSGLGLLAAALVAAASRPASNAVPESPKAHARLATVSTADRSAVDYARLDARLKKLMESPAMVGLAVGVVENGRITFLSGYGETEAGSGEQVGPDTVFRWASVSKGVAATMVAKLAENGKLNLHGPVGQYTASLRLPGGAEERATVGDLLSHRLGLYRNAYDNKLEEGQATPFLRQTLAELNLICPPGTCWSYQNVAYDGASEIVERLTGLPFEQALKEELFIPIGMTSASASREALMAASSWARPHSAGRRPLEVKDAYYRVPAAGGVNSNIKDLALWLVAQLGGMPEILSPRVLETVHAPVVKTPGENRRMRRFLERVKDPHYGYGWRSYDYSGHRVVGHHGGVSGYRALIMFDPVRKSGVVAMWNSNTSQPTGIEFEVMDMIYGLPFRDWLALDSKPGSPIAPAPESEPMSDQGSSRNN